MHELAKLTRDLVRRSSLGAALVGLGGLAGCGEATNGRNFSDESPAHRASGRMAGNAAAESAAVASPPSGVLFQAPQAPAPGSASARQGMPGAGSPAPVPKATANRKIIYDTTVDLITEDLNKLEAGLTSLIEAQGAYVADSARSGAAGSTRSGNWKVRVPVDVYDRFVRGVIGLGELVSTQAQSQDVSAEYYDLDARTAAKKVEESRLLKHLADSTGRLDEILAVERELTRVRSEIEQMQGRLAVLSNLTSLATVTITASEVRPFDPPQNPTLGQKVVRTFTGSLESLQALGVAVLLAVVALAPWLPLILLAGLLLFLGFRWARALATSPRLLPPPSQG